MVIKCILPFVAMIWLIACGKCEEDQYGESLELIVPITTFPNQDTFHIGDTLWMEANIDKNVEVNNSTDHIRLDSFNFFSEFIIAEISDTMENYIVNFDTIVEIGSLDYLPLSTAIVYPIHYIESAESYRFKAGIVLKMQGMYLINFYTYSGLFERPYEHPGLYACGNNRRDEVLVIYRNQSTTMENYSNLFLKTKVEYLIRLVDFEEYSNQGCVTIIVQ